MRIAPDRWMSLAEIARRMNVQPDTVRHIAQQQRRAHSSRYTTRTLRRWPPMDKNASGRWGCWESEYVAHQERLRNGEIL
jgi:hypothetical protein